MNNVRLWLGPTVMIVFVFFTGVPASADVDAEKQTQLLVMLHQAPPHYRPGAPTADNYGSGAGTIRSNRRAKAVAKKFGLRVIEG